MVNSSRSSDHHFDNDDDDDDDYVGVGNGDFGDFDYQQQQQQRQQQQYFENVEILYDRQQPLDHDLVLRLRNEAITLRFEPRTQRLKRIDLHIAEHRVQLAYQLDSSGSGGGSSGSRSNAARDSSDGDENGSAASASNSTIFCTPDMDPTFVKIYQVFGPTYPGVYDNESRQYYLSYPGITFVFPIPEQYSHIYEDDDQAMPLEFPNGTTPIATKMYLFMGYDFQTASLPQIPSSSALEDLEDANHGTAAHNGNASAAPSGGVSASTSGDNGDDNSVNKYSTCISPQSLDSHSHYFEEVRVNVGKGICFVKRDRMVLFGDSPQQVIMSIGRPDDILYKRHDKLRIHAIASQQNALRRMTPKKQQTDTSTKSPQKKKSDTLSPGSTSFIINKNQQSAVDYFFNYFGLGMDIMFDGSTHTVQKIILHTNFPGSRDFNIYTKCNFRLPAFGAIKNDSDVSQGKKTERKRRRLITPDMKFKDIHRILGGDSTPHSRPLMNDHTLQVSPFGGTRYYAYQGVIFEVMKNDHLNSLQLFT